MWALWTILAVLLAVTCYDLVQRRHAILRNFPIIGHFRYLFEAVGPELRQYIVTNNDEERPFNRDERRWVYASAKLQNNYFGFGTDNELEHSSNYLILKQRAFPIDSPSVGSQLYDSEYRIPAAKVLGAARGRRHAFRPQSIVNVSAMSFGSLSAAAVAALNRGCAHAGCLQNTGEGGVAPHHRHGGDLIWQIGTGYFGCRAADGAFDLDRLLETVAQNPIRGLEIKISQGAKPGLGGLLPEAKVTPEISKIRGIPMGQDCISPARHSAFGDVDSMLDFVEMLAEKTGLPIGIKSAVGELGFFEDLSREMESGERGVDFITIDGGEGGTGAAPLAFSDHVALPFKIGMSRVYKLFVERGVHTRVVFNGSGKLGFPLAAAFAFALGCDTIGVGREAMMAIGCIQAQRCHSGHCPTGVATQNRWLMRGLVPTEKAARLANYVVTLRKEILRLCHAAGAVHPALLSCEDFEILDGRFGATSMNDLFGYGRELCMPAAEDREAVSALMSELVVSR